MLCRAVQCRAPSLHRFAARLYPRPDPHAAPPTHPYPLPPAPLCAQVNKLVLEVAGEQLNSALSNPFFGVL